MIAIAALYLTVVQCSSAFGESNNYCFLTTRIILHNNINNLNFASLHFIISNNYVYLQLVHIYFLCGELKSNQMIFHS